MTQNHMHTREFIIGAGIGSLLGSVAALLVAPKSGKKLRRDICDTYCDFSERTQDLAKRGKTIAQSLGSQSNQWAGKAKQAVEGAKKSVKGWMGHDEQDEEEGSTRDFLIGGVAGGIVGAAIGLILAPKSGDDLRQDIIEKYEDMSGRTHTFAKKTRSKANKWLDFAREVVDDLTEEAHDKGEDLVEKAKSLINHQRIHEAIDWAALGVRVWQKMKDR